MQEYLSSSQVSVLRMINEALLEHGIPYVIIGGLAAIGWGVKRPLADIDILVYKDDIKKVRRIFKEYINTDIRQYKTKNWDIVQMILKVDETMIDICQAEQFTCIKKSERFTVRASIRNPARINFEGMELPILPKRILIEYKRFIDRPVDQEDLKFLI